MQNTKQNLCGLYFKRPQVFYLLGLATLEVTTGLFLLDTCSFFIFSLILKFTSQFPSTWSYGITSFYSSSYFIALLWEQHLLELWQLLVHQKRGTKLQIQYLDCNGLSCAELAKKHVAEQLQNATMPLTETRTALFKEKTIYDYLLFPFTHTRCTDKGTEGIWILHLNTLNVLSINSLSYSPYDHF